MSKVWAIALNTFKEAVRNRILYVLLFFSVVIMFGAWIVSTLSIESQEREIRNLGVGAINLISVLIAVFVGIGLVYNELDKKTIYTIISKPITRWQFLVGKYVGLLFTILVNVLFMTVVFCAVANLREMMQFEQMKDFVYIEEPDTGSFISKGFHWKAIYFCWAVLASIFEGIAHVVSLGYYANSMTQGIFESSMLTMLEMMVITAFTVLFSSFSSPTLSAFMTVIVFIIGRMNQDLYLFAEKMAEKVGGTEALAGGQAVAYYFAMASAHIAPNLEVFNARTAISEATEVSINLYDLSYGVVYSAAILLIAIMVFNRRNFK